MGLVTTHSHCFSENSHGFLTCSGEPDRPMAAWALDEHSGIWCKPNTSSEHRDQSNFVLSSASVKFVSPQKWDMHSNTPMRSVQNDEVTTGFGLWSISHTSSDKTEN